MTTVEEDLLLNEPETNGYNENLSVLDEDLLLGAGDVARKATQESVDDIISPLESSAPIPEQTDDEEDPENNEEHNEEDEQKEEDHESEKEELDYDEEEDDEEKRERTSRYTSEKKGGAVPVEESDVKKKVPFIKNGKTPGIPSLFSKTITNNPMYGGEQPIGVILRIEGEQEKIFYPPPSFFFNAPVTQNIVPRLPNGIPLVGVPANHGRAGFGEGWRENASARMAGGGGAAAVPWEKQVSMFLNQGRTSSRSSSGRVHRKRRNSSYSSYSDSSASSRSRSSSRSDRRRRGQKDRRRDDRDRRDDRRHDRRDDRRHDDRRPRYDHQRDSDRERDSRRRKEQSKNATIESAKALGLSNEYMDKMNEQKRKREEIVRKKEERRFGNGKDTVAPPVAPAAAPSATVTAQTGKDKPRAFLSVNVSGVQHLPTAVKKIEQMAVELGPIKKCWRSADDVVSIIFHAHDKAKTFMTTYNGKVLSGMRISVSLEKKFLNPSEIN